MDGSCPRECIFLPLYGSFRPQFGFSFLGLSSWRKTFLQFLERYTFFFVLDHVDLAKGAFSETPEDFEIWNVLFDSRGVGFFQLHEIIYLTLFVPSKKLEVFWEVKVRNSLRSVMRSLSCWSGLGRRYGYSTGCAFYLGFWGCSFRLAGFSSGRICFPFELLRIKIRMDFNCSKF